MKNILTTIATLLLFVNTSLSQIELSNDCNAITEVHELSSLDGFSSSMEENGNSSGMLFCWQDGVVDNPNWLAFRLDPYFEYTFEISFDNCVPGQSFEMGGQLGIYDSCEDWSSPIYCEIGEINGTHIVPTDIDLEANTTYYLLLDGFNGSLCDVSISVERYLPMEAITDWKSLGFGMLGSSEYWYRDIGDTIINNLDYRVLDIYPNPSILRYVREDKLNKKVYSYNSFTGEERLLYDFSAVLGDVIDYSPYGFFEVVEIDFVESEYGELKRWTLDGPGPTISVVEGIGSDDLFLANTASDPVFVFQCAYHEAHKIYGNADCTPPPRWSSSNVSVSAEICEGEVYDFNGTVIAEMGIYMDTLVNAAGFDSIVTLNLNVLPLGYYNIIATYCQGDILFTNGIIFDEDSPSGNIILTGAAANGCDSIVHVDLTFLPEVVSNYQTTFCEGSSEMWADSTITMAGDYTFNLMSVSGCDSTINLSVDVIPDIVVEELFEACEGDSIMIDGEVYSESGMYQNVYQAVSGCDSIQELIFNFLPVALKEDTFYICSGDTLIVGDPGDPNAYITTEGVFDYIYTSSNGCDSTYTAEVIFLDPLDTECVTSTYDFQDFDLNILPNPFNHSIHLASEELLQSIEVTNIGGVRIDFLDQIDTQDYAYDGSHLLSGVYILTVRSKDRIAIKRIVKY